MAISALLCLHWDQVADPARRAGLPRLRARRLPAGYLAAVSAGVAGLIALPYAEEALRCARHARRNRSPDALAGERDRTARRTGGGEGFG